MAGTVVPIAFSAVPSIVSATHRTVVSVALLPIVFAGVLPMVSVVVLPTALTAQTIRGVVSERATYEPIEGATVILIDTSADTLGRTITDERGFFSLDAPGSGDYYLIASALGYGPVRSDAVTLEDDAVRIVELDMAARPIPVEGVLVETEGGEPEIPGLAGTGFYDRLADGWGEFMTPGEVLGHSGEYTHQLFREMVTVELVRAEEGPTLPFTDRIMLRSNAPPDTLVAGGEPWLCEPLIYIDGVRTELMAGESLHDAAPRDEIEAIEVHPAPFGAPLRYFPDFKPGACGVVLIWMR